LLGARSSRKSNLLRGVICVLVLALAVALGQKPGSTAVFAVLAVAGGVTLLVRPEWGIVALVIAALLARPEFSTGTDVKLNIATLLVPALAALWVADRLRHRHSHLVSTRVMLPLLLFLGVGLISLVAGNAFWDPSVPRPNNFTVVQLAQWAIWAFSAIAFYLSADLLNSEARLKRTTTLFLALGGVLAVLIAMLGVGAIVNVVSTIATFRAPFWILLTALVGGQLLFNRALTGPARLALIAIAAAIGFYALVEQREATSNWAGVAAVAFTLVALRFRRLRVALVVGMALLLILGILVPAVYNFAGGDVEWQISGGSRMALIERVVSVTMRNPITGLGPAAYRPYTRMQPLAYGRTLWQDPQVNAHNNYVDIFAQTGVLGLGLFLWFMAEVAWMGWRLQKRYRVGFSSGYVNGMLAAWVGIMVVMVFLDWFLPFVYNVGFPGFQASVLVWVFLGGLVALENMEPHDEPDSTT
jgi:hypothetical protein